MQRILRYFADVHLGNSHRGLSRIASKEKVDVRNLGQGEFVVFVNTAQTAFKMFASGNVIAHFKHPEDHKIDPRTILMLPNYFNGAEIGYDKALRAVMEKEFKIQVVKETRSPRLPSALP